MKKFFDRLRRWLIKKLGGYTEQFAPTREIVRSENVPVLRSEEVPLQKLQAEISIARPGPDSAVDFKRYCEHRVMERLMQEIYQSGFILWESQYDIITQRVNVRATLRVVNANDLRNGD